MSRQTASGHAANNSTPSSSSSSSSASSIKPTGWIRSTSASRSALSDRTNLPSGSRSTPLRSLPKLTVQSAGKRSTPVTNGAASKQQKLSHFFAPNTAPSAVPRGTAANLARSNTFQDSPSLVRARGRTASVELEAKGLPVLEDDELEARAASLLRGRFGSVTRSLNPSRSSTPVRAPSPPRSDPEPVRRDNHRPMQPPPSVQARRQPHPRILQSKSTPPRPARVEQQPPSSSPTFEPTLMAESLSNFTPPAWEKNYNSRMALFKRLAGVSKDEIFETEKANMAHQVAKAHARMQPRSPTSPRKGRAAEQQKAASPRKNRIKEAAALASSPQKQAASRQIEAVLRSPRTNRRIYALETQLGGGSLAERSVSLQPMRLRLGDEAAGQRRAVSEARHDTAGPSTFRQSVVIDDSFAPRTAEEEEESETQPLPWPAEGNGHDLEVDVNANRDETQPLPWEEEEEEQLDAPVRPTTNGALQQPEDDLQATILEVPPSDDEDLLQQKVFPSSSSSSAPSSPSPSPTRLPSIQRADLRGASSPAKRQRIKHEEEDITMASPTFSRSQRPSQTLPLRSLPTISPISLAPSLTGGADRFGQIVAALKKGERRQNNGMQLNLNSFVSSSKVKAEPSEARREGLSEDLEDVLSDDDDDSGDTTVTNLISSYAGGDAETDETQPLPWDSSPTQLEPALIRPRILPLQSAGSSPLRASQRTTASSTSSSSSGIIPSQTNLNAEGNTQLRTFFHDL
ncbi:hypothetical protein PSEUBRA_003779 [Kalmanozyma brasiliensis GHG001]|uniref:uncharacterized protein n=1 Tax=Kalmanozyma brasiliensis (strain GHG001) TaxID=1365824 RepID=UPI001CEB3468|nr:uncharacterized protein PSEUBRA_003779 [Kalmanozyma brasiliensis GHG001]EST06793.2 hypothetical protein PSEUBRA_003779 [Kalmanozyma brasiliensis GHG001]